MRKNTRLGKHNRLTSRVRGDRGVSDNRESALPPTVGNIEMEEEARLHYQPCGGGRRIIKKRISRD